MLYQTKQFLCHVGKLTKKPLKILLIPFRLRFFRGFSLISFKIPIGRTTLKKKSNSLGWKIKKKLRDICFFAKIQEGTLHFGLNLL